MKRFLKRLLKWCLPATCRRFIRRHISRWDRPSATKRISLSEEGDAIRCTVDGICSFLAPADFRPDLEFHAADPTASEELYGIGCLAKKHGILFDVGAHVGLISTMFCAANETNRAYSFEPSPISVKRLEQIRQLNRLGSRMDVQPVAIGERVDQVEMIIDTIGGFAQVQLFENSGTQITKTLRVDVENISDASERLGVIPDMIKLDIEGYEFEAIKGAAAFLARHRPTICFELHLDYLEERKVSAKAILSILEDCQYSFYRYSGGSLSANDICDSHLSVIRFVARKHSERHPH